MEADTDLVSDAPGRGNGMSDRELGVNETQVKLPASTPIFAESLKEHQPLEKDILEKNPRTIQGICVVDFVRCNV